MTDVAALTSELLAGEYQTLASLAQSVPECPTEDERWLLKLAAATLAASIQQRELAEMNGGEATGAVA